MDDTKFKDSGEARLKRMRELEAALERERIKYERIRYYFNSPMYSIKNVEITAEVCEQLQASAMIMQKFRTEYDALLKEIDNHVNGNDTSAS